jgi:hypothetical protein
MRASLRPNGPNRPVARPRHSRAGSPTTGREKGQTRMQIAQSDFSLAQYPKQASASDDHFRAAR